MLITELKSDFSVNQNIPLKLVEKERYKAIKLLYKQSYSLTKLQEAGFVTDPFLFESNGESAFTLAIRMKSARAVVHTFYVYLSSSERTSDLSELKKLSYTFDVLQATKNAIMRPGEEEAVSFIEQLMTFNNFQADIAHDFHEISTSPPNADYSPDIIEIRRRQEKLIHVLTTYLNYFSFRTYARIPEIDHLENVIVKNLKEAIDFDKYITYFEILDLKAALLFFDNLFFVKHKLKHSESDLLSYEEIESKYLLFLFTCEVYGFSQLIYPSSGENEMFSRLQPSLIDKSLSYNVLFERRELFYALWHFKERIHQTPVSLRDTNHIFNVLTSVPKIRDVIILRTILRYLNNVFLENSETEKKSSEKVEISLLVTERLLHVLGEALKEGPTESLTLGKSFLVSSFLPEVRKELCAIRDTMVHVTEGTNAKNRLRVERSMEIEGIKNELKDFKLRCEEFLEIVELQMKMDILLRDYKSRGTILNCCLQAAEKDHPLSEHLAEELAREEKINLLGHIQKQLKNQIYTEGKKKPEIIESLMCQLQNHRFFSDRCKTHLEVQIAAVEDCFVLKKKQPQRFEESLSFRICCIEVLLSYCIQTFKADDASCNFNAKLSTILKEMKETVVTHSDQGNPNANTLEESRTKILELFNGIYKKPSLEGDIESRGAEKFSTILKLGRALRKFCPLSESQKEIIIKSVPEEFVKLSEAEQSSVLMPAQLFKQEVSAVSTKLKTELLLPSTYKECNKNILEELCTATKTKDPFRSLKQSLDNDKLIGFGEYKVYCSTFDWSNETEAAELLKRFVNADEFETKIVVLKEQRVVHHNFLNNKVTLLEKLLINCDPIISELWFQGEDPEKKKHAQFLIVQTFLRDKRFQAALEMLLLDIMCVQKNAADAEDECIKASGLFSGINLRNVLAHQNPLIEEIGNMLDPDDLATIIVRKCLKIVETKKLVVHEIKI